MVAWLKLLPAWAWAAAAGLLLALVVGGVQEIRVSGAQAAAATARAALADYKKEIAERDRQGAIAALQETKRRLALIDEVETDAQQQTAAARNDADAAGTAIERLQQRLAAAELRAREAGNAITAQLGQAAEAAARMRADVLSRVGAAAGLYAGVADERGIAGTACERAYDGVAKGG
uniref:DUF2514 domain-containing protein n=1 Tax=viral metagenome TaxID=1070528 RepID=A0A6M3J8J5_9ZZZZ